MITFAEPLFFLLFIVLMVRVALLLFDRTQHFGAFEFSSLSVAGGKRTAVDSTSWLPILLEIVGLSLLIIALARPQRVQRVSDQRTGIDMVIALDASGSMAAEDFPPRNRFAVAKDLLAEFLSRRTEDRIGIVTFGARAATRIPITFDQELARSVLEKTEIGDNGDGTAIGHAIATAVNRLKGSPSRSKVIILLTDGVNTAGSIEPSTAAALAARYKIKIYAVGIGSRGDVPIPVKTQNRFTGEIETVYQIVRADLDDELLTKIAQDTGGAYFRAVDVGTMESILATIDRLERTKLAGPQAKKIEELHAQPLLWGMALLALALLGGETVWLKLPA